MFTISIIVSLVLMVGAAICLGAKKTKDAYGNEGYVWRFSAKCLLALLIPAIAVGINCFSIVPANTVGVRYSPFSGTYEQTLPEGFNVKGPMDKVYKISSEVQTKKLEGVTGQTKDAQYITMNIDVKFRVDSAKAFEIFRQYRTLDNVSRNLIAPTVQRAIETVTTSYNVIDILGEKRNEVYGGIEKELAARFEANGIQFAGITFVDTDAGANIENAIQAEAVAKKAVETAEQERLKAEIDAQKRVVEAKANQDKAKIEAETKLIEAEAEAAANRVISESVTEELLKKMEMEARIKHGWIVAQGGSTIVDTRE